MIAPLTCQDLERLGLWQTSKCCRGCHAEIARGEAEIEVEPDVNARGRPARARLVVCCNFYPALDLALDRSTFARALRARRRFERIYRALTQKPGVNDVPAGLARVLRLATPGGPELGLSP